MKFINQKYFPTSDTHMSWGRVESSVLVYKNNEPPLSILRNFRDARSVYSLVTANMSTQTPAWTATAAYRSDVKAQTVSINMKKRAMIEWEKKWESTKNLPVPYKMGSAQVIKPDQHPLLCWRIAPHTSSYPAAQLHNQEDQIERQIPLLQFWERERDHSKNQREVGKMCLKMGMQFPSSKTLKRQFSSLSSES